MAIEVTIIVDRFFCTLSMSRSIRDYFHIRDGLPDPRESLSSQLPSQAIALANKEVEKVLRESGNGGVKRQ